MKKIINGKVVTLATGSLAKFPIKVRNVVVDSFLTNLDNEGIEWRIKIKQRRDIEIALNESSPKCNGCVRAKKTFIKDENFASGQMFYTTDVRCDSPFAASGICEKEEHERLNKRTQYDKYDKYIFSKDYIPKELEQVLNDVPATQEEVW